jgi:hypothetical protein
VETSGLGTFVKSVKLDLPMMRAVTLIYPSKHGGKTMEEDALVQRIERMIGYVPIGTRDLLHILSHPDVIDITRKYLDAEEART